MCRQRLCFPRPFPKHIPLRELFWRRSFISQRIFFLTKRRYCCFCAAPGSIYTSALSGHRHLFFTKIFGRLFFRGSRVFSFLIFHVFVIPAAEKRNESFLNVNCDCYTVSENERKKKTSRKYSTWKKTNNIVELLAWKAFRRHHGAEPTERKTAKKEWNERTAKTLSTPSKCICKHVWYTVGLTNMSRDQLPGAFRTDLGKHIGARKVGTQRRRREIFFRPDRRTAGNILLHKVHETQRRRSLRQCIPPSCLVGSIQMCSDVECVAAVHFLVPRL